MQTQDFYSGSVQSDLHPLSSSFNPKLEVPLFQGFRTKPSSNTIGLWFQSTLLDFGSKHPLQTLKDIILLNNPSSDTLYLRIPK